ncbi:MAG: hypothetical protein KKG92_13875, partial [Gammaproteobacteria bacterium]|nr:hypothetical protein [Gammaproteobacteria bacterium]
INMLRTTLPFILAATLATFPALAEDGFDFMGGNVAQVEKVAKAPREKNDGHWLENQAKGFAAGTAAGVVNGAVLGAAALNPLVAIPTTLVIGVKTMDDSRAKESAFYSGSVVRGRVNRIVSYKRRLLYKEFGISEEIPSQDSFDERFRVAILDVDGTADALVFAFIPNEMGIGKGDIIDVKSPVGVFVNNSLLIDNLHFNFNKHVPRVIALYCKHDQPCQNDYESSLGVLYRHQDKEFPVSQYLIDPAIIAADQAKMRKEAEESKAAANSGGFSFM